jgi:hypothetical protein
VILSTVSLNKKKKKTNLTWLKKITKAILHRLAHQLPTQKQIQAHQLPTQKQIQAQLKQTVRAQKRPVGTHLPVESGRR